ncbi:MAG TPA: type 1 glutamine amidotransferase domain-containing protein [Burkholderiaceae bacterium]|jgi:putative intracellular protease/amidase
MKPLTVLIPIPNHDFDPSEVAVPWKIIRAAGHRIEFATPDGLRAYPDPRMISGEGLDPWGWIPGLNKLRLIGLMLRANGAARAAYRELESDENFLHPKAYTQLHADDFDALLLPGGHAKKVRAYLENSILQGFVADFFESKDTKPVAAVCHGVVLAARSMSKSTGKSVLYGRKTTALTWKLEKSAWDVTRFFARFWDPDYYRTYRESKDEPAGYWSVEQEIKRALEKPSDFLDVDPKAPYHFMKSSGLMRDSADDARPAWVVRDRNYLSARWPGDVHTFARQFVAMLNERSEA